MSHLLKTKETSPIEGGPSAQPAATPFVSAKGDFSNRFGLHETRRDLKGKTLRGGAITIASQFSKFGVYTAFSIVMSRLLSPRDYGLVGMVTAVTALFRILNYGGLSTATVQRKDVTHELISTVFWLNIALGISMTLVCVLLSPCVAWLYHEPQLLWITVAMASVFLLDAASSQHLALLRRSMKFGLLAGIEMLSMIIAAIVALLMAFRGFGFWALIAFQIVVGVVSLMAAWIIEPWRPGLPHRRSGAGSMLKFGGFLTAGSLMHSLFRNCDNILIGWRWGTGPLAFYQKAYSLLMLPVNQVNVPIASVAIGALSRLNSEPDRQRRYFVGGCSISAAITMPIVATAALFAGEIIPFALGPQWNPSVRMFQLLAPATLVGALFSPLGWLFVASGRTDRQFKLSLVWTILILASFVAGLPFGAEGVAIGFSAMSTILIIPACLFATRGTPIRLSDIAAALKCPAAAATVAIVAGLIFRAAVPPTTPLWVWALGGPSTVLVTYALVLLVGFRQWYRYREIAGHLLPAKRANLGTL